MCQVYNANVGYASLVKLSFEFRPVTCDNCADYLRAWQLYLWHTLACSLFSEIIIKSCSFGHLLTISYFTGSGDVGFCDVQTHEHSSDVLGSRSHPAAAVWSDAVDAACLNNPSVPVSAVSSSSSLPQHAIDFS